VEAGDATLREVRDAMRDVGIEVREG
jgi:hypothetical protein